MKKRMEKQILELREAQLKAEESCSICGRLHPIHERWCAKISELEDRIRSLEYITGIVEDD